MNKRYNLINDDLKLIWIVNLMMNLRVNLKATNVFNSVWLKMLSNHLFL